MKYKILSICGSGIATSTLVASRLKEGLEDNDITDVVITEANVSEASGMIANNRPDVVVHTTPIGSVELNGVKSFDGIPILMNRGARQLYAEIAEYLKELENNKE
ncbi:MAG: hypothetical protein IJJ00_03445 [Erysipelotrichaceae bacterium]|nr:hypothetical protein [Erysipelotrichaceae bacterium]